MKQPFFIVGTGRCGTTFVHDVLEQHPRVALTNEARVFDFLHYAAEWAEVSADEERDVAIEVPTRLRGVVTRAFVGRFAPLFARHVRQMVEEFYAQESGGKDYTHFGDKLPTAMAAAAARRWFPDVKYVALVRDPRDYVCSAVSYARAPHIARAYPYMDVPLHRHCEHWVFVNQGMVDHLGLAPVHYEELILRPLATVSTILASLGLTMDPACESAIARSESFATHGTSATAVASGRCWRQELSGPDLRLVEDRCGELMERLGYHKS